MTHTTCSLKSRINLKTGYPNVQLLPVDLIRESANKVLSNPSIAHPALLYGPDPGDLRCRKAIATWLGLFYRPTHAIPESRICITGGASQSLGLMLSVYTDPEYTLNVWIVAPAYFLAFRIFQDEGFGDKLRAVPEDEQGIDIQYLRREMSKRQEQAQKDGVTQPKYKGDRRGAKVYRHVVYCVPTFGNPSSRSWTLRRRQELVKLAREFDALVVSDDVYDRLQWRRQEGHVAGDASLARAQLPRLVDIDGEMDGGAERAGADGFGNTVSNGSFSKIAGPGMRIGWVEGTDKFSYGVSQAGIQASGGAPSQLTSTYMAEMLGSGQLDHHIATVLQPAYSSRYFKVMTAIKSELVPLGFGIPQADGEMAGGYFTWLSLPEGITATALEAQCRDEENVIVAPGNIFEVPTDNQGALSFGDHIRVCWSWEDASMLGEAIKRIAAVTKRMLDDDYVVVDDGRVKDRTYRV
ncbi:Hypothetical protein R9X50_00619800 [Acrodontium crateriforme]|uniref:Aminotransferase class I/classII large domain-containing protein n=1 Tax=Acrodontium crateriforme TaxID=150365 RepID=A0AAQ3R6M0_9PEZI|nr:Hypothetical protein R9X50_00619800 [Acrodontium crateriforme]